MSAETSLIIRCLSDKRIVIFAVTPFGLEPILSFANEEEFAKFALTIENFHRTVKTYITKVPDVFERAFYTEE